MSNTQPAGRRKTPRADAPRLPRRPPKKANWVAWGAASMLPLRDAVALSLGFEPASVSLEHGDFALRLKLAVAHFRERRLLRLNMQERSTQPALSLIWLPHFAAWARNKPKWALPPEMAALAQAKLSASDGGGATERRAARARSWQDAVRGLADELHRSDLAAGAWCSLKEMAQRVAVEAAKHNIHGPRGELSEQNILRAALSAGQWKRPRAAKKVPAKKASSAKKAKTRN